MKGTVIALGQVAGRDAAALMIDGRLHDLIVDPAGDGPRPGAIYRARVGRALKGLGGAFLETPDGPLFLRQAKGLAPGQGVLVQVVSHPEPGKAAPATLRPLVKSRYVIVTPGRPGVNISREIRDEERRVGLRDALGDLDLPEGCGLILRSACADADDAAVLDDLAAVLPVATGVFAEATDGAPERLLDGPGAADLAWRDWPAPQIMADNRTAFEDHGVLDALAALDDPQVALGSAGSLVVEPTRALVAVDINTGDDGSPAGGLKADIAALRELPRQLRLRGLGGQIVVDLAPFPKKERRQLEQVLRAALKDDPIETTLVGWTPLGHMELQRKRERPPLGSIT